MLGAIGNAVKYGLLSVPGAVATGNNFDVILVMNCDPVASDLCSLNQTRQPMHEVEGKLSIVDARTIHPKWHLVWAR
jgi:hypothetical protein